MVRIIAKAQQGSGAFNGGEIVENKPIGFPQDHSSIRPYSNLFYWAHAKAVVDSTIGLHPHQGFEICSFVLRGEIRHYDTKLREWRPLQAGDVQIIRAGNGISHSEWIGKDGEIFQIWFDPNLEKTLSQPASYDDYRAADFPETTVGDTRVSTLAGAGSPFRMETPGVEVRRIRLGKDQYTLSSNPGRISSVYVIEGEVNIGQERAVESDFVLISDEGSVSLQSENGADVFVIESPIQPGYRTYGQIMAMRHWRFKEVKMMFWLTGIDDRRGFLAKAA